MSLRSCQMSSDKIGPRLLPAGHVGTRPRRGDSIRRKPSTCAIARTSHRPRRTSPRRADSSMCCTASVRSSWLKSTRPWPPSGSPRSSTNIPVVRARSDGRVGEREARVGQYVLPGPSPCRDRAAGTLDRGELQGNPDCGDAGRRRGDHIHRRHPWDSFSGRVESLSPASGAQFALLPPDNATGNFTHIVQRIPVKIAFDPGQTGLDHLRPGMSAAVALHNRGKTRSASASR